MNENDSSCSIQGLFCMQKPGRISRTVQCARLFCIFQKITVVRRGTLAVV